jgi:hypothetical protein
VSVTGVDPAKNLRALEISRVGLNFADIVLFSRLEPRRKVGGIRVESITNPNWTYDEFSKFMLFELFKHVKTEFALFVHHRAHVLRPKAWTDEFLNYDYIGAPWSASTHFTNERVEVRVGNGGFSLRSQRLMRAPTELNLPFTDNGTGYFHEDGQLCVYHRDQLEKHGIKFPPVEVAAHFSTEVEVPETVRKSFGYHNNRSSVPSLFYVSNRFKRFF